jgi:hypothetical protein
MTIRHGQIYAGPQGTVGREPAQVVFADRDNYFAFAFWRILPRRRAVSWRMRGKTGTGMRRFLNHGFHG